MLYAETNRKSLHYRDCCFPLKNYTGDADFLSRQDRADRIQGIEDTASLQLYVHNSGSWPKYIHGYKFSPLNPAPGNISEVKNSLLIVFLSKIISRVLIIFVTICRHSLSGNCAQTSCLSLFYVCTPVS